jgi:hypothetical protein
MREAHRAGDSWKQVPMAFRAKLVLEMGGNAHQVLHPQFARQIDIAIGQVKITGQRLAFCLVK